jgi:hypothetical protein
MAGKSKGNDAVTVVVTMVVLIGLIVGGVFLLRKSGSDAGGPCTDNVGCKPGLHCYEKVCRTECTSDADCASGLACANFDQIREGLFGQDTNKNVFQLCVPPIAPKIKLPPLPPMPGIPTIRFGAPGATPSAGGASSSSPR